LDAIPACRYAILIHIHLRNFKLAVVLLGDFLQDGGDRLTRSALFCPEVGENGDIGFEHLRIEGVIGDMNRSSHCLVSFLGN